MKRWAIITVGLYGLLLLSLTVPGVLLASAEFSKETGWKMSVPLSEARKIFAEWGYWLWLVVLVAAQALLLVVPVRQTERRPISRRSLSVPVAAASFLLGNLLFAGVFALLAAFFGDKASIAFEAPAELAGQLVTQSAPLGGLLQNFGIGPGDYTHFFCITTALGYLATLWLAWAFVFFYFAQSDPPDDLVGRATRWLIRGSILELLVAIPSHIIVRHRNDCCAPVASLWGIVTGLSVMLLAFGPGVYFLFARRMRQAQPRSQSRAEAPTRPEPNLPDPPKSTRNHSDQI